MKHSLHIYIALFYFTVLCLALTTGCSTIRYIPVTNTNTVTDTVTVTRTVKDTILLFSPDTLKHASKDTVSFLSNSYAESTAEIACGYLKHTLITYPRSVKISIPEIKTDRIRFERSVIEKPYPVEVVRNRVPNWVWWSVGANVLAILLVILKIILKLRV